METPGRSETSKTGSATAEAPLSAAAERKLLRRFDRLAKRRFAALADRFGDETAGAVREEAREHYRQLAPEVAAIGDGILNGALEGTYEYLAYYKALKRRGQSVEEIGGFFQDSFLAIIARFPQRLIRLLFRLARPFLARRLRREAAESQRNEDPSAWRFSFVDGDKGSFDFGFDVTNCAVCAVYARHDASEVVPYLCALDDDMSQALGMGLRRRGTRALGSSCCDFRYGADEPEALRSRYPLQVVSSQAAERE